jgi:hypothetical protein
MNRLLFEHPLRLKAFEAVVLGVFQGRSNAGHTQGLHSLHSQGVPCLAATLSIFVASCCDLAGPQQDPCKGAFEILQVSTTQTIGPVGET